MLDKYMDPEVIDLCKALNCIPGIKTKESCSGHGEDTFRIFFNATDNEGIFFLARCADRRYWKYGFKWKIYLRVSDLMRDSVLPTDYILESEDIGLEAYKQAEDLIESMTKHLNHENFKKGFGINLDKFKVRKSNESYMFDV